MLCYAEWWGMMPHNRVVGHDVVLCRVVGHDAT